MTVKGDFHGNEHRIFGEVGEVGFVEADLAIGCVDFVVVVVVG